MYTGTWGGDFNAARKFKEGSGGQIHLSICNLDKTAKFIQPLLKYVLAGVLMGGSEGDWGGFLHGTIAAYTMPLHNACAVIQLEEHLLAKFLS